MDGLTEQTSQSKYYLCFPSLHQPERENGLVLGQHTHKEALKNESQPLSAILQGETGTVGLNV